MKNWIFQALKVRIFGIRLQRLEKRCLQKFPDKSYEKLTNISGMYNKGGRAELRHFAEDGDGIYKLVKERAIKAGVKQFSPHDFRRTFCSNLFDANTDTFTVQQLAGHVSPATTAKYDRRGEETKRKAIQGLKLK